MKDSAPIPSITPLYRAKKYFDEKGIKNILLVITSGLRPYSDFAKALVLGADAIVNRNCSSNFMRV